MTWRALTPEEARAHPLYGVRGWLGALTALHALFLIIALFACLSVFSSEPASEIRTPGAPLWADRLIWALILASIMVFLFCARRKSRWTAEATAFIYALMLVVGVVLTIAYQPVGDWPAMAIEGVVDLLIVGYLFAGARPNVTFKHRVRA